MNTNRSLRLVRFAVLAMLTACFGANLAHAQTLQGKFNLPFEVQWGQAVLPPGDYSFTLTSDGTAYNFVVVHGEGNMTKIILSHYPDSRFSGKSALVVERYAQRGAVRQLRLAEAGLVFSYPVTKAEQQVLAQGPVLIQRLPVLMAKK
jgi:hypothetical protein